MNKIEPELEYTFKYKEGNITTFVCKLGKELTEKEKQKVIEENIQGFDLKGTNLTRL